MKHAFIVTVESRALVSSLSFDHALGVAIMEDVKGRKESGGDFFVEFSQKLGFMDNLLLMSAPTNWLMYCSREDGACITNRRVAFK